MTKIRVFLTAFGFSAEPHPTNPTALILRACPFVDPNDTDPVAMAIQQGMLYRVIERTGVTPCTSRSITRKTPRPVS